MLDADDTLWESALFFERTESDFLCLLESLGHERESVRRLVHRADVERLAITGYGARPYLDTLRTILDELLPDPPPWVLRSMRDICDTLLGHPVLLMPGVRRTLEALREEGARCVVYTMGERVHQGDKFERSGLSDLVDGLRIVDLKTAETLRRLLGEHGATPGECVVVGNSPRSDINPALAVGAHAVHVVRDRTWAAEREDFAEPGRVRSIESFDQLPEVLLEIERDSWIGGGQCD